MPTNPCAPGTSTTLPGVPEIVAVSGAAIESALILLGQEAVAAVLAPLIVGAPFETESFCQNAPPDDPGLTAADVADALEFTNPLISVPAIAKVKDWFYHQYWYKICGCSGGTTPAPTAPSNPNVTVGPDTNLPGPQPSGPCWQASTSVHLAPGDAFTTPQVDLTKLLVPQGAGYVTATGMTNQGAVTTFANLTNFNIQTVEWSVSGDVPYDSVGYGMVFISTTTAPPATSTHTTQVLAAGQTFRQAGQGLAAQTGPLWFGIGGYNPDDIAHEVTLTVSWNCGTGPQLPNTPCCPPDPNVALTLNQILGIVNALYQSIPTPINSFAEGVAHSGLTGSGSFGISGTAISVKIHLDVIPSSLGHDESALEFYFDLGYLAFTTVEGSYSSTRINFQDQVFSIPTLGYTINYSLHPGVHATVTELLRGP
jgi:hypothetical protein